MQKPDFKVCGLGEIAIRCNDIGPMLVFYRDVIGLDVLSGDAQSAIVFFKIADGFEGHTTVLALFDKDASGRPGLHPTGSDGPETGARSSLHHLALNVSFAEQEAVMAWYDSLGQPYRIEQFGWIGWRGIFTSDPEGNTVELVAYDASMKD